MRRRTSTTIAAATALALMISVVSADRAEARHWGWGGGWGLGDRCWHRHCSHPGQHLSSPSASLRVLPAPLCVLRLSILSAEICLSRIRILASPLASSSLARLSTLAVVNAIEPEGPCELLGIAPSSVHFVRMAPL
jgi:hypothetical protein